MQMENIGRGANGDRVQGLDYKGGGFVFGHLPLAHLCSSLQSAGLHKSQQFPGH